MSASPPAESRPRAPARRGATGEAHARSARVQSVDLLRGADVLLMLFVNEVARVAPAPAWLKHVSSETDGMTITDVVFPAFLFIVGIAVPFALGGRLRRGESRAAAFLHVLARTAALVVMGVLMVNAEHGVSGPLSPPVWTLVTTAGVFLLWGGPESGWGPSAGRGCARSARRSSSSRPSHTGLPTRPASCTSVPTGGASSA